MTPEETRTAGEAFALGNDRAELACLNHPRLTDPQRAFASMMDRFGVWVGGNSIGKSFGHAWDICHFVRGTHPFRGVPSGHRKILLVGYSFAQMDPLLEKLWMMLPKGEIHPKLYRIEGQGIKGFKEPVIPFIAGPGKGSVIHLATYEQGASRIMGFQGHRLSFDEPPPAEVYAEAKPRLNRYRGEMRTTLTPTPESPPLEYLRKEVDEKKVVAMQTSYNLRNVTVRGGLVPWSWKTAEQIADEIAGYLPDERGMREHGDWEPRPAGRWLEHITEEHLTDSPLPEGRWFLAVAADHGARPGRQSATLCAANRDGDYWLVDEARTETVTTSDEDAEGMLGMLARNGLTWKDVDHWIGDRSTNASSWGAQKSNEDLQRALAAQLGMTPRAAAAEGLRFAVKFKNQGSVRREIQLLNTMAMRRRLWIRRACKGFIKGAFEWTGDMASELKDPIDSGRYGVITLYDRQDLRRIGPTARFM